MGRVFANRNQPPFYSSSKATQQCIFGRGKIPKRKMTGEAQEERSDKTKPREEREETRTTQCASILKLLVKVSCPKSVGALLNLISESNLIEYADDRSLG